MQQLQQIPPFIKMWLMERKIVSNGSTNKVCNLIDELIVDITQGKTIKDYFKAHCSTRCITKRGIYNKHNLFFSSQIWIKSCKYFEKIILTHLNHLIVNNHSLLHSSVSKYNNNQQKRRQRSAVNINNNL